LSFCARTVVLITSSEKPSTRAARRAASAEHARRVADRDAAIRVLRAQRSTDGGHAWSFPRIARAVGCSQGHAYKTAFDVKPTQPEQQHEKE
ncbi:MAG: hypothetical protein WAV00_03405, partial [Nocardioides sp.]